MQVYHSVYGQGTVIREKNEKYDVRFASGVVLTVLKTDVRQVIND
jgi:hypothetical protein